MPSSLSSPSSDTAVDPHVNQGDSPKLGIRITRETVTGLLFALSAALLCIWLQQISWLQKHGFGVLTIAIVLGIVLGNTILPRLASATMPGIVFAKQQLLRLGIVLFGFRLTFQDIADVGMAGVMIDALVLISTFLIASVVGRKHFGMDRETVLLIGAGSAICGAAAVLAAEPVIKAKAEQVSVAVSTVVVFGTLAMFTYPLLYQWNLQYDWIALSEKAYGIYVGSTLHEVAQVVVAGGAIGEDAANTAVIAKMVRVMMLAPFLLVLSLLLLRQSANPSSERNLTIPWFAVWFLVVIGINSTGILPGTATEVLLVVDQILLAMAMFALGLTTQLSALRRAGLKPLGLAALLAVWLMAGGLLINLLPHWMD